MYNDSIELRYGMDEVKLSIIVPIYHISEEYIDRCILSILSQSFEAFELILVFDGEDEINDRILNYLKSKYFDSRIKYVMYPLNHGVSYARNVGIKSSKGEFLGFVDADDYLNLRMYEKMVEYSSDYDLVFCRVYAHYEETNKIVPWNEINLSGVIEGKDGLKSFHIGKIEEYPNEVRSEFTLGAVWRTIIRRDLVIQNNVWFDTNVFLAEDSLFLNTLLLLDNGSARKKLVDEYLYYYFQRKKSAMHNVAYKDNIVISNSTYVYRLREAMNLSDYISEDEKQAIILARKKLFWNWIINNELYIGQGKNLKKLDYYLFRDVFFDKSFELNIMADSGLKGKMVYFLVKKKMYSAVQILIWFRNLKNYIVKRNR